MTLATHSHESRNYEPLPFPEGTQLLSALSSDLRRKRRAEPVPPIAVSFISDIHRSLVKQVFDISQ